MTLHEGRSERDRNLDLFEVAQPDYLTRARTLAAQICISKGYCTVDDVRALLPPPPTSDKRIMGAIFRSKLFVKIGNVNSGRRECHARPIAKFGLRP